MQQQLVVLCGATKLDPRIVDCLLCIFVSLCLGVRSGEFVNASLICQGTWHFFVIDKTNFGLTFFPYRLEPYLRVLHNVIVSKALSVFRPDNDRNCICLGIGNRKHNISNNSGRTTLATTYDPP